MKVINKNILYLIFTKQELQAMLDYSNKYENQNIVLIHEKNNIATIYGICTQAEFCDNEIENINFTDITDYESW